MEPRTAIQCGRSLSLGQKLVRVGVAIVIAMLAIAAWDRHVDRVIRPSDVMLIYVGADDCAPCRAWRKGDGAAFFASTEFARVTYREVRSPHLDDVLSDANWPVDIRDYRSRIRRSDGVPLWLVIADRAVVDQQFGATAWRDRILPTVRSYLR